ncbi:MAG: hypothetical protein IJA11_03330 [Oscillospiraceae bacterium]|nr:hypothetical protein [Oscillospiraceae bacterium]
MMSIPGMINTYPIMMVIAAIAAVAATVLTLIFIVPEKYLPKLGKFGKFLHDAVNFKFLIVEKLLQVLYILSTCLCIFSGLFSLLGFQIHFEYQYFHWFGGQGLLTLLVGPIVVRLVYELLMMALLLVKNVIQINSKLKGDGNGDSVFSVPSVKEFLPTKDTPPAPAEEDSQ